MCGIAGYAGTEAIEPEVVRRMCDALAWRGPDGAGYHTAPGVSLGMRRLAVIDVDGGDQPIFNEDGTVVVVFNGEIYNFAALRAQLERAGHRFRTRTDTEVIVHLYEDRGERCVEYLRGMFAFALWDAKRRRLLLARDRIGKKPLYYHVGPDGLWFASELKALLAHGGLARDVDPVALHHYLTWQYVPEPWSILRDVQKLPPAHTLVYEDGRVRTERYWQLRYGPEQDVPLDEALGEFDRLLDEATRLRMVADRPIGAFLSGGIDSSLVVAAMAAHSPRPVKTFCIGFEDARYDERAHARTVAQRLGADHHELVVGGDVANVIPVFASTFDEPFADSSAIPSLYLSALAREHVTVVLNGDGGDESFGGYLRYVAHLMAEGLPVPERWRPAMARALRRLPRALDAGSAPARAWRFLLPALGPSAERYPRWMCHFDNESKAALYTPEQRALVEGLDAYRLLTDAFADSEAPTLLGRTMDVDVRSYLPGDLLVKMDRSTMRFSLEARSPLLDHVLMEFAATLPSTLKVRRRGLRFETKHLLREAARRRLGADVAGRGKKGFGIPLAAWLRTSLRDLAYDVLTDATASARGYFRPQAVRNLLRAHMAGDDQSTRLWNLIALELWLRAHHDAKPVVWRPAERIQLRPDASPMASL